MKRHNTKHRMVVPLEMYTKRNAKVHSLRRDSSTSYCFPYPPGKRLNGGVTLESGFDGYILPIVWVNTCCTGHCVDDHDWTMVELFGAALSPLDLYNAAHISIYTTRSVLC